ncbi:hypothetical protein ACFSTI_19505 [Rhizorhabdus histidinilytica]|uniref:Uncharacterized protein n=1 Tax=Rhizorhabdus histidinilytica TaxID=439228 RepID=A0A1T5BXS6_9SPHN|nr:hypothetical protein [Rhizorhabdus histidinilytica]SKB51944.1 hypothetical protein SAMN06295920_103368 [Rhizorhabdus histidinilytica]
MADRYARGFRAASAAGKRLIHEMADQLDRRTDEECRSGQPPSMVVQKLHLAAQRVGALNPNITRSRSGIPLTKDQADD